MNDTDKEIDPGVLSLLNKIASKAPAVQPKVEQKVMAAQAVAVAQVTEEKRGNRKHAGKSRDRLPARMPTTTVHQGRMPIYAPVRRPRAEEIREYKTPWGDVRIKGRLGQAHADLIECLWSCGQGIQQTGDGRIAFTVDLYRVRKKMSSTDTHYSYSAIKTLLVDIMSAVVETVIPSRKIRTLGHLLDHVVESDLTAPDPRGGERKLWSVELGRAGADLLLQDLHLHRRTIAGSGLRHAVSQAVARHVLSHRAGPAAGWHINSLLTAVGVPVDSVTRRNRRRELQQDTDSLASIGIKIENGRVWACSLSPDTTHKPVKIDKSV